MGASEEQLARARRQMVDQQLRARGIADERVLEAFAAVPRERFLPPDCVHEAYGDYPVPIGSGQTISQPYVVALMVEALRPRAQDRVLDVGAGSGYQVAILARLAAHVYAVERIEALARRAEAALAVAGITNVTVRVGDGSLGWPEAAPFDRIMVTAGAPRVPEPLREQLADGGRLVLPVGSRDSQMLERWTRRGEDFRRERIAPVAFVPLIGEKGWSEMAAAGEGWRSGP